MLRQISLEVKIENKFQDVAKANGVKLAVTDCRPFNMKGMTMLLEIIGPRDSAKRAMSSIRGLNGVREGYEGEGGGEIFPFLVVLDRPSICRASSDAAIICLQCPFSSQTDPATWRFITGRSRDLREIISNLGKEGIRTRIEDASMLDQKTSLTVRQKEIMAVAMAEGYFEFPRKRSLTALSQLIGVKPSTLSEILRSAERRIMQNAVAITVP